MRVVESECRRERTCIVAKILFLCDLEILFREILEKNIQKPRKALHSDEISRQLHRQHCAGITDVLL